ncbi:hypothetical protein PN836_017235 [Ningiella sp. W23]|uniref:hypothetical protein n=1 Tax=Ningiella sp. W23 TaxID=3023715 RepID=UPI0037566A91
MKFIIMLIHALWEGSKHLLLLILIFAASKLMASEGDINQDATDLMHAQVCPERFFNVEIPQGGKLCQVFDTELPASMIFFVPSSPQSVIEFYQKNKQYPQQSEIKNRFILKSDDNNITIIISEDGSGSQVDVLVKANLEA